MSKLATEEASGYQPVRAPRGSALSCKGWQQEAALRMLMNNLDPEVAEKPEDLIVYGGRGKAARNWKCYHAIVASLRSLENDETLLVQSGKPVGIFRTHSYAPRVLIANSNLVGHWSDWKHFDELDRAGLMMYGQMTAGSWIYIGTQGILQGTYETFAAAARQAFRRRPRRKIGRQRRHGRHGRRAAARRNAEWRGVSRHRRRSRTHQAPREDRLLRCDGQRSRRSAAHPEKCRPQTRSHVRRPDRQLRGRDSRARPPRRGPRSAHRSNQRARSRSAATFRKVSSVEQAAELRKADPASYDKRSLESIAQPRGRHARAAEAGLGHIRLRQQHPHLRISSRA